MADKRLRVALAQYLPGEEPAEVVGAAQCTGAEIVVLPEMYSNGYAPFERDDSAAKARWCEAAEALDGAFLASFREAARRFGMHVVASFLEASALRPFNSAMLIDSRGQTALHYRKVHICDFDVPEMACGAGTTYSVSTIATRAGPVTLGLMICMDREFAEPARSLSLQGAELILVPNCCDLATDRECGDVRIAQTRGRAYETVTGIAVANYPTPRCDGHSFAVAPSGAIVALADTAPGMTVADFDLAAIRKARVEERFRWG